MLRPQAPDDKLTESPVFKKRQDTIEKLVALRYTLDHSSFLRVTEMDYFEQLEIYRDKYPMLEFRMKLWQLYM